MKRILLSDLFWMVVVCLLIVLVAPFTLIGQHAMGALVIGFVTFSAIFTVELIHAVIEWLLGSHL